MISVNACELQADCDEAKRGYIAAVSDWTGLVDELLKVHCYS